jgi:hypothetical protein
VVLLDLRKQRRAPSNIPLYRATCFANGAKTGTTTVNGRIVMRGRLIKMVDETKLLNKADRQAAQAIEHCGLSHLLETPTTFWRGGLY